MVQIGQKCDVTGPLVWPLIWDQFVLGDLPGATTQENILIGLVICSLLYVVLSKPQYYGV